MKKVCKNHIRLILPIFFLTALFFILPIKADAFSVTGPCGTDVYYEYSSDTQKLVIKGNGSMKDYTLNESTLSVGTPWEYWDIKSIEIKEGVTHIGSWAFNSEYFAITNLVIPASCHSIGDYAFFNCSTLKTLTLTEGLTSIGASAFSQTDITAVTLPSTLTSCGEAIFGDCTSLSSITIKCAKVPDYAFQNCELISKISFSSKCTTIGNHAFFSCRFPGNAITIPSTVKTIQPYGLGYGGGGEDCSETKQPLIITGTVGSGAFNYAKKYGFEFRIKGYTAPKIRSAVNVKTNRIKLTWYRKSSTTGYQIAYSLNSAFISGNKYINITSYKTTSKTTPKLTKKKYYYIRIRAYRTVSGKKCYSPWSSAKKVYIKK